MLTKCKFCGSEQYFVNQTDGEGYQSIECDNCDKTSYPDKFKPGDLVISKIQVDFCDGTIHRKDQRIIVTELTVAYFNVNFTDYRKGN